MRRVLPSLFALALLTFLVAGCGDDGDDGAAAPDDTAADATGDSGDGDSEDGDADGPQDANELAESMGVDDMIDAQEAMQEAQGGGGATLTVGDQTWEFDSVLCTRGAETGRAETEFVLSSIQDGLQLDATIDTQFGHSVSLNDVEDFENPRVSLNAGGPMGAITGDHEEIIEVDGDDVYAEAQFFDDLADTLDTTPGTLTATCP